MLCPAWLMYVLLAITVSFLHKKIRPCDNMKQEECEAYTQVYSATQKIRTLGYFRMWTFSIFLVHMQLSAVLSLDWKNNKCLTRIWTQWEDNLYLILNMVSSVCIKRQWRKAKPTVCSLLRCWINDILSDTNLLLNHRLRYWHTWTGPIVGQLGIFCSHDVAFWQ